MWKINRFILYILPITSLFGGTVRIFNDSPYQLKADILAADGSHQGTLTLAPQQQGQWQSFEGSNYSWSQTPYTAILTCKNGKQYGVLNGIQQGATVSASNASGPLFCEKDKKEQDEPSQKRQGQTPYDPYQQPFDPTPPPSDSQPQSADPHSAPGDPIWGPP